MSTSDIFFIIQTVNYQKVCYFDAKAGRWFSDPGFVQTYASFERAIVDAQEFDLADMVGDFTVQPYRRCMGLNGQTIILPA